MTRREDPGWRLETRHPSRRRRTWKWLPLRVGAYAYYDIGQVARTAIELFEREIEIRRVSR